MSEIDFSGLKKKKKKPITESLDSLTLESQMESHMEGSEEKEEIVDFSELKKKKKKKVEVIVSSESINQDDLNLNLTESQSERDYTYNELLSRVFGMIRQNNPELVGEKKKFTIPPPQVVREGTKKTLFANIAEICKRLHRLPDHLIQYLFAELGTTGSIDGGQRLLIKGRFQQKQIEIVLKRYIAEYVQCKTCRSPDTNLVKENRLFFLQCESCGSSRTVSAIKTGFMAQTGKRSAMRNAGYKDLFESHFDCPSEYRKPSRKQALSKKLNSVNFENPLKEAISNRRVSKTNIYYIRKTQKLAPSYWAKLTDLEEQGKIFRKTELLMEKRKIWEKDHILHLQFDQNVQKDKSPVYHFINNHSVVWNKPDILQKKKEIIQQVGNKKNEDMVDHGLHKSSWLRDVERPETIRRLSLGGENNMINMEIFKSDLRSVKEDQSGALSKKETFATRNVEFMLDIWQKSEGVDLKLLLKSGDGKCQNLLKANQRSKELAYGKSLLGIEKNDLFIQAVNSNLETRQNIESSNSKSHSIIVNDGPDPILNSLKQELFNISSNRGTGIAKKGLNKINEIINEKDINYRSYRAATSASSKAKGSSYLSKSTLKALKKISVGENQSVSISAYNGNSKDLNHIVKLTLTGPQETKMEPYFLSAGNYSVAPSFVNRRHRNTSYSPGAWLKLMKSSFLPNGDIRVSKNSRIDDEKDDDGFQLILHDISKTEIDDEEIESDTAESSENIQNETPEIDIHLPQHQEDNEEIPALSSEENLLKTTPTAKKLSSFQRRLSIFNQKQGVIENKILTLEELDELSSNVKDEKQSESISKSFHLSDFCSRIKQFLKRFPELDTEEPAGLPLLPPNAPKLNRLCDFVTGPYCELTSVPEESIARISLMRALSLALRETQQKELCYEAAQIIIKSGLSSELGRWDALLLKDVLSQILKDGNKSDKDIACISFCENNQITEDIIQHLRTGLGDIDDKRRQQLNHYFSNLDIKYATSAMTILFEEAANINYRVRVDVIHQISNYIERLSNAEVKSQISKTESHDMNPHQSDIGKSEVNINDELIFNGIEILLQFMWGDWSEQVRELSSKALGELHQGNALYNHLIHLIQSDIPVKRLDALKCLGYIGVITETALSDFINCFKDQYASIRLQACKVACKLKSNDRHLMQALLDSFNDSDWHIRIFAIKAVGLSGCGSPKARTCLHWCMMHDENPSVRAEAISAFEKLGYVNDDSSVRDWLLTLLQTDTSELVVKEAEKVLVQYGVILPSTNTTDGNISDIHISLANRIPAHLLLPFPNILSGKTKEEVEIFLRDSLIEDKEQLDVINQVRVLAKKEKLLEQVQHEERNSGILPRIDLDLDFDKDHIPDLKSIHGKKKRLVLPLI